MSQAQDTPAVTPAPATSKNEPATLWPEHIQILRERAIDVEYAKRLGVRSVDLGVWKRTREKYKTTGEPYQHLPLYETTGMLLGYQECLDNIRRCRVRVDNREITIHGPMEGQEDVGARTIEIPRYLAQAEVPVVCFWTPEALAVAADVTKPIWGTEAPLKAMALACNGFPAFGMGGVLAGAHDPKELKATGDIVGCEEFRRVNWQGRRLYVTYDASITDPKKPLVSLGAAYLALAARNAGADVWLVRIPPHHRTEDDVERGQWFRQQDQGPDDFLARQGVAVFHALVDQAEPIDPCARLATICSTCKGAERARRAAALLADLPSLAYLHASGASTVAAFTAGAKVAGIGARDVRAALEEYRARLVPQEKAAGEIQSYEYAERDGQTCLVLGRENDSVKLRRLANFTARIIREVARDDGVSVARTFAVDGKLVGGSELPTIEVAASEWSDRAWVTTRWGARAIVEAGRDTWGHIQAAIQSMSNPDAATVFTHTGWRKLRDKWAYLFPGSSVGAEGIDVADLDDRGRYRLPPPCAPAELRDAIRRSLAIMHVGPAHITIPILSAAYTAPLSTWLEVDLAVWLVGDSGACKSGLVALTLCHFGKFSYNSLPASWLSTANALEAFLFRAKDTLSAVDNYVPGAEKDAAAKANRIVHQIGDRGARGRNNRNSEQMPARPPRGLTLMTGEDLPVGPSDSTLGRLVTVKLKKGDVDLGKLVDASRFADSYGHAMRGYIEWLRERVETIPEQVRTHRDAMASDGFRCALAGHTVHPRTARSVATLGAGFMAFLRFAQETGGITVQESDEIRAVANGALVAVARAQAQPLEDAKPHEKYLAALRAMLAQGIVTLASVDDDLERERGIGWTTDEWVYLHPDLTWKAVEQFYSVAKWPYTKHGIHHALADTGIVARGDGPHIAQKKRVGAKGTDARVLVVARERLADGMRAETPAPKREATTADDVGLDIHV